MSINYGFLYFLWGGYQIIYIKISIQKIWFLFDKVLYLRLLKVLNSNYFIMGKKQAEKNQSIRLNNELISKLRELDIEVSWIKVKTYEDKISHLLWFFEHYINNNKKH